jgi:hypothetical protein
MEIADLLQQFHNFDDGVLRRIEVNFRNADSQSKILIELSARNEDSQWTNVQLEIAEVTDFRIADGGRGCYQVLSDGLRILNLDKKVVLLFNEPNHDILNVSSVLDEPLYVVGESITWTITEYSELPLYGSTRTSQ